MDANMTRSERKSLGWHVSVLIPARDEERLLGRCLHSVLGAVSTLDEYTTADIIVAVDSSTDRTAQIAAGILGKRGSVLLTTAGAAGTVRAVAANYALGRNRRRHVGKWWLANTDADCVVPSGWLTQQLQLARGGIEAFAGTVNVDSFEEHGPQVAERFRASYKIAPDGWHPHVHGANLGVRADTYMRAGGWAPLQTGEDHDFWNRLVACGAKLVSTARIEVLTSGRRVGRAPDGFADALAAHNEVAA
jgi:glycosyltransferase involved in cell wall biosynthesis